jgi:hypothetical protein
MRIKKILTIEEQEVKTQKDKAYQKKWRKENRAKANEYGKIYYKNNRIKILKKIKNRYETDVEYREVLRTKAKINYYAKKNDK